MFNAFKLNHTIFGILIWPSNLKWHTFGPCLILNLKLLNEESLKFECYLTLNLYLLVHEKREQFLETIWAVYSELF